MPKTLTPTLTLVPTWNPDSVPNREAYYKHSKIARSLKLVSEEVPVQSGSGQGQGQGQG